MPTRTISRSKKILYTAVAFLGFCSICEIAARVVERWIPPYQVDYGQGFDADTKLFVAPTKGSQTRTTNPNKFLSFHPYQEFKIEKKENRLRIFMLGGSSVYHLGRAEEMCSHLEKNLGEKNLGSDMESVEFINCGGHSYGSHRLVAILIEVLQYHPDVILLYTGHNEFEELEQLSWADLDRVWIDREASKSAFFRLLRDRITDFRVNRIKSKQSQRLLALEDPNAAWSTGSRPITWSGYQFTEEDIAKRMAAFEKNIATMIRLCQAAKVPLVIGTVPSNLVSPVLPKNEHREFESVEALYEQGRYTEGASAARDIIQKTTGRHQSSDVENGILRSLANDYQVSLADVEAALIDSEPHGVPGETLFRDHCHLNSAGNTVLQEVFAERTLEICRSLISASDGQ